MALNLNNYSKQFYSIGEVAEMFDINETTLRYWEKEFSQISPKKTGGKMRLVHNLVKVRGLKIAAARELLKKNKEGTVQTVEVIERLRTVRTELLCLKKELNELS